MVATVARYGVDECVMVVLQFGRGREVREWGKKRASIFGNKSFNLKGFKFGGEEDPLPIYMKFKELLKY